MSPDIAASVRARLLAVAKETGEEFERTLARYAAERWLYRLGMSSARERCILKGAALLAVWLPNPHRATRDVDLLGTGATDDESIQALFREVADTPCAEDGITFDLSTLELGPIRDETDYPGIRALFWGMLGSARIRMQVDIGIGDAVAGGPEEIDLPRILGTLPSSRLRAYPREQTVAEKFEAMVRLEARNSRMKDFHDLWVLAGQFAFDGVRLRDAVTACFARRGTAWTEERPLALRQQFYGRDDLRERWRGYLASTNVREMPPRDFDAVGERLIAFLGPIRDSIITDEAPRARWTAARGWESSDEEAVR